MTKKGHKPASENTSHDGDRIAELEAEVARLNEETERLSAAAKRALADLENFRRRTEEEKKSFVTFANSALLLELIPVLDNFERAAAHAPAELKGNEWVAGMLHIEKQFLGTLNKLGITKMSGIAGSQFNPHRHEAILQGPGAKDTVIEELEAGYLLGDKVLRPAKVKVGDGT